MKTIIYRITHFKTLIAKRKLIQGLVQSSYMKQCLLFMAGIVLIPSCQDDWLEEKRDIALAIPTTLEDMRALLDNTNVFQYDHRGFADPLADEYYLTDANFQSLSELDRNVHTWNGDPFFAGSTYIPEWDESYRQVFIANVVLEEMEGVVTGPGSMSIYNNTKGGAFFFRARAFFNLAQLFCAPYDPASAQTDPGIPLRLVPDVEAPVVRSSVEETYTRIIADLEAAAGLLNTTPEFKTDASRPAAFGLLARTNLSMRDYDQALLYADSCLQLYDVLLDYNKVDGSKTYPFEMFNDEVIMHGRASPNHLASSVLFGVVDPLLLASYDENDLRRSLFFRSFLDENKTFWGAYTGSSSRFSGIAVDEMLLIRAECNARQGNTEMAMDDINTLLEKRYRTGTFVPLDATGASEALSIILAERRKELLFRGLRWMDLRRLNKEPERAITIKRTIAGKTFTLPPNDPRYVLPIPDYVIEYSGIPQNQRQ